MFAGGLPPRDTDLWLVESRVDPRPAGLRLAAPGVICFTPGTLIDTPAGPRRSRRCGPATGSRPVMTARRRFCGSDRGG
ncbi:hypothetical protein ACTTAM_02920 [Rhodobacter capsulatus]|uniref:hypothetical protein n=1 Tax=Rhodobacter capsulatus TaxID=1061 RepID=UPI0040269BFD